MIGISISQLISTHSTNDVAYNVKAKIIAVLSGSS